MELRPRHAVSSWRVVVVSRSKWNASEVPLVAGIPVAVSARADVHRPDHQRDEAEEDDSGPEDPGDESFDTYYGDDADREPSEHVGLARKRPLRHVAAG